MYNSKTLDWWTAWHSVSETQQWVTVVKAAPITSSVAAAAADDDDCKHNISTLLKDSIK